MKKPSVDEIIDVCQCITNSMMGHLENFVGSLEDFDHKYVSNSIFSSKVLKHFTTDVKNWQNNCEDINQKVAHNKIYLETMIEETDKLKTEQTAKETDIAKMEERIELLKREILSINKKKNELANMRDCVQTSKLLTNTTFAYKGSSISGCVLGSKIDCFEFDPDTPENDIINNLYDRLEKSIFTLK